VRTPCGSPHVLLPGFAVGVHLDKRSVTWQGMSTTRLHPEAGFETWLELSPRRASGDKAQSRIVVRDACALQGKTRMLGYAELTQPTL